MQDSATQEYHRDTAQATSDHLIHVYLYGELAERYGAYIPVYGRNTGDCIACISANFPDFQYYLSKTQAQYRVIADGKELTDLDFFRPITELHIHPVVAGSGGGFGKLLLGAALLGASFIPGVNAIAIGATLSLQGILFSVGIGLALSGIGQLLAPKPKENETSYVFSNTQSPAKQGDPIPIPFGELYFVLNNYLISGAIDTELVAVDGAGGKFGK